MEISFLNDEGNCKNILLKHHLLKNYQILAIENLIPEELYSLYIVLKNQLPTSQKHF